MFSLIMAAVMLVAGGTTPVVQSQRQGVSIEVGVSPGGGEPWNTRRPADYGLMRQAGVSWLRGDLSWATLQPDSQYQSYKWSLTDPAVADAQAAGFQYLAILHTVPEWANNGEGVYAPPTNLRNMQTYCYRVAQRYLPRGVKDYEMGNEVNLPHQGWTISGSYYVANFLNPCVAGVRKASTELGLPVNILLGSLVPTDPGESNDPVNYLREIYVAGGASRFNVLSWHPYGPNPLVDAAMNGTADALDALTVQYTGASRSIWATEYGAPTGGQYAVTEERQAELVGEALTAWSRHPYAGPLFWYSIRDLGELSSGEREDHFGVVRKDGSLKPAYGEMRRLLTAC